MADIYSVWDKLANKYDRLWVQKYSLTPTRSRVKQIISDHFNAGEFTLIDLGCGTGQFLSELRESSLNCRLIGIDKSPDMIKQANSREKDIDFMCLDIDKEELTQRFTAGSIDAVVCCHSFPYYKNKANVLMKLHTLLKANGIVIFVQASVNNIYDKVVLQVIEATAEKADYLSRKAFRLLTEECFKTTDEFTIHERFFMPSICGVILRKRL